LNPALGALHCAAQAETTYLTARRSLKRLRRLIGQLDSTQGFTRRYLLGSVDRLLDLKNWDNDDSIRVSRSHTGEIEAHECCL